MNDDLPNLPLLIKLLKLTTSQHDCEALSAMRKANEQLLKFGGDWETLLRGKVTIIADPFAHDAIPTPQTETRYSRPAAPPPPPPPMKPYPQPYTSPLHATSSAAANNSGPASPPPQKSYRKNQFAGICYCCGTYTKEQLGFLFKPNGKHEVICINCNSQNVVVPSRRAKLRPSTNSLHF